MRALTRVLYFTCFAGLALVAALALNGAVEPRMAAIMTRAVLLAAACAAPGLVYRKLWPLAIVLLPMGCYLLVRTVMPLPAEVEGVGSQYHFYAEQLNLAFSTYYRAVFQPLRLTEAPELQLLLAFSVYWLTGVAAFMSLSLRRPLPAVALTMVLLGFGATIDASARVLWPALLFVVLAGCLLVLARGLKRSRWHLRDAVAGGVVSAVASLLAVLLLATAPSVAATPWQDWHAWTFGTGRSVYTFNWLQNYPRLLNPADNAIVMRVESSSPSYWRASALDSFTGSAWVTSQPFEYPIGPATGLQEMDGLYYSYIYSIPPAEPTPPGKTVIESFDVQSAYTNYFFTGGDPQTLGIDLEAPLRMNDLRALRVSTALGPAFHYSLVAIVPEITPSDLVGLGSGYPRELDSYLTLPFSRAADIEGPDKEAAWRRTVADTTIDGAEWVDLYALNEQVTGDATDPYDITLRIEQYLRRYYEYSLSPPPSGYSSPYAAFLFDTRSGYCQHFAGTMALLLRYNGIPARVAVGFVSGEEESDGLYIVGTNNAHAWVEVYFPTVGWVAFDPTPGRRIPVAGASSTSPGFANPFPNSTDSVSTTVTSEPVENDLPGTQNSQDGAAETDGQSWLGKATWLPWVGGLAVVLVGWPLARGLWRTRRLRRGSPQQRLQASLGLLRADLFDHGVPATPAHTLDEVLRIVQTHLGMEPEFGLIDRADSVLFGGRSATREDVEQAEALRLRVRSRLRQRRGWLRTGFAWYRVPRLSLGEKREA